MINVETSDKYVPAPTEDSFGCFIKALYRVFQVGIYYPIGHVVFDQAAGRFIQLVRETFPTSATITITRERNDLVLGSKALSPELTAVRQIHSFMAAAGIRSIEVDRHISHKQFLRFVRSLLAFRVDSVTSHTCESKKIVDLAPEIQILLEENLNVDPPHASLNNADDRQVHANALRQDLLNQGQSEFEVQQYLDLLQHLSAQNANKILEIKGFPFATWQDIEKFLNVHIGKAKSRERQHTAIDEDVVSGLLDSLQQTIGDRKTRETFDRLFNQVLAGAPSKSTFDLPKNEKLSDGGKDDRRGALIPLRALQDFVDAHNDSSQVLNDLQEGGRSEILSIVLQNLQYESSHKIASKWQRLLVSLVGNTLTDKEKIVLLSGMKDLVEGKDEGRFRTILPLVLATFRKSPGGVSCQFVVDLWRILPYSLHRFLWPFAVNELLLVGMTEKKALFYEITELAATLQKNGIQSLLAQLEELEAFREKRIADKIFRPSFISSYQLFAALLQTSLGQIIAANVLDGLQKDPQDRLIEAIGPFLQPSSPSHLQFLGLYLAQAQHETISAELKNHAGLLLLEFLNNVKEEQKEEAWLEKTITATADFPSNGVEVILEKIVSERTLGVVPVWPRCCRKAAEDVLQIFKSRKPLKGSSKRI